MPSDTAPAEEPDGEESSDLPEDSVRALIEQMSDELRKVGLYFLGAIVHEDATEEEDREGEAPHHRLMLQFSIGDIAFQDRVQDPENEKMKDAFREIETATIEEQIEAIRAKHRKKPEA